MYDFMARQTKKRGEMQAEWVKVSRAYVNRGARLRVIDDVFENITASRSDMRDVRV